MSGIFKQTNRLGQFGLSREHMAGKVATHGLWAIETKAQLETIDGSKLSIYKCSGQSDLVVNTAAQCAFIRQIDGILSND
jgi:hypothetical protein